MQKQLDVLSEAAVLEEGKPQVHNMIRWVSKTGFTDAIGGNWLNIMEVDAAVDAWVRDGYKLFNTHYLGETPEAYGMWFVLVREP